MRSLTRVSVLMGPPLLGFFWSFVVTRARNRPEMHQEQWWKYHAISKKALHKQGPMPTDRGLNTQAACANAQTGTTTCP